MSDDSIFREIDEAVRHDKFKELWDKYGIFVLLGAIAIVALVAGYNGWTYWQTRQSANAGARFAVALDLEQAGQTQAAGQALRELAVGGPRGYRMLARFHLAAAAAKAGDGESAVAAYDGLAADTSVDEMLRGYAAIQAASLRVDDATFEEIEQRLGQLAEGGGAWRHSARELIGLSAYRGSLNGKAEDAFTKILTDAAAPFNLRQRADMMLALIVKADAGSAGR